MNSLKIHKTLSDAILLPALIQLKDNLFLARFELMKILPAKHIVEMALKNGKINPSLPIVETSSGTFALGLGMVCCELKIPFYIVSDPAIDAALENQLTQLGGKVQILSEALMQDNPQEMRLSVLKEYIARHPGSYWTRQYDNLENQDAYGAFAEYLHHSLGKNITLVGSVGSGGSTCGTIKKVRESSPISRLIGVDTFGSVLFGLPNGQRLLRGLGNSLMPKNLTHEFFDEVHWVDAAGAFAWTRKLYSEKSLFCGPTTGAAYQVANWVAEKNPHELVVCISADQGYRYQNSVYSDRWLTQNQILLQDIRSPVEIEHPLKASLQKQWCYLKWERRTYQDVMSAAL